MEKKDTRIDEYISASKDFAKPILKKIRTLVHLACSQVEEIIKWSFPNFDYKGPLCSMAAFKEHCSFGLLKTELMQDAQQLKANQEQAMGHLGKLKT